MDSVRLPKYRRHKGSGQADVTLGRHQVYLGRYGTAKSRQAYRRAVAEFVAAGGREPRPARRSPDFSVVELVAAYWQYAQGYYVQDGKPSGEFHSIKTAMRRLKSLYGDTPAAEFGPLALKAVRATMIAANLSRSTVNHYTNHIRRAFRWVVAAEMVPPGVYHGLQAAQGLEQLWKVAVKRAGLPKALSIHCAHHTMAVHLLRKTRNLRQVQKQLGHADPAATANMYADVSFEDMRAGVTALYGNHGGSEKQ
ncbi:MAG: tyrosine-type recombinase/integrase [Planctomycetes bacterium]|nr:tyrosine-type recombinase/integrase [Planctomycetota bacterium]